MVACPVSSDRSRPHRTAELPWTTLGQQCLDDCDGKETKEVAGGRDYKQSETVTEQRTGVLRQGGAGQATKMICVLDQASWERCVKVTWGGIPSVPSQRIVKTIFKIISCLRRSPK